VVAVVVLQRQLDHVHLVRVLLGGHLLLDVDDVVDALLGLVQVDDEVAQALREVVLLRLVGALVGQLDVQVRRPHQVGEFAQALAQHLERELGGLHDRGIGLEADHGAGAVGRAHHAQFAGLLALAVGLAVRLAVAEDFHQQLLGQRIDDRDADAVQTAGDLVAVLVELPARVQLGHDHFERRRAALVHVDRDAAAVVAHRQRAVLVHADVYAVGLTGQRLVDGVVDHLPDQVVQSLGTGVADVHGRTPAHGVQSFQDLDGAGVVAVFADVLLRHARYLPGGSAGPPPAARAADR
jgi:hypothetical protein